MEKLIPLLSALTGGILGFFASYITNKQNNKFQINNERILFIRKKKEELYCLVARIKHQYRGLMGSCITKVTHNKELDFGNNEEIALWDELDMLVNLYFRKELSATVSKLNNKKDKVGEVIAKVITFKGGSQDQAKDINGKILTAFMSIDNEIGNLLYNISAIE